MGLLQAGVVGQSSLWWGKKEVLGVQYGCRLREISFGDLMKGVGKIITFREKAASAIHQMSPQIPSISKVIITLNQLHSVPL